jgi:hypothetical protein
MFAAVATVSLFKDPRNIDESQFIDESFHDEPTRQLYGLFTILSGLASGIFFGSQLLIFKSVAR